MTTPSREEKLNAWPRSVNCSQRNSLTASAAASCPRHPLAICSISSRWNGRRLLLSRSVGDPELSDRLLHGARELLIEQANATLNTWHCADNKALSTCARALFPSTYL